MKLFSPPGLVLILLILGGVPSLVAQELRPLASVPQEVQTSSAVEDITNQPVWFGGPFEKGSPLHFGLTVGETYDDNIFISPQKTADFITHLTPSIDFEMGDKTAAHSNYLNIFFAPTIFLYAKHPGTDREDYNADLYYQYAWTRLTLGLDQNYQHVTDANIDIGNLAAFDVYTTAVNGSYWYNDKLSFFGTATQRITNFASSVYADSNEWILDSYALYEIAPKLSLGGGPRFSFIDISGAPNQSHQDLLLHLTYDPKGKISVTFAGGMEYLQYQDNTPSHVLPIFDLTANYTPRDGTSVSLAAFRQSLTSYDEAGETYLSTSVQLSLKQRVLRDIFVTLSGTYNMNDYQFGDQEFTGPQRDDNYYAASIGAEWDPKEWLNVALSYEHSADHSTFSENSFNDNRIDVQASAHF